MAKILIIDDDPGIATMMKDILELHSHEVITAFKPDKAKKMLLEHDCDLLIMDKVISGYDGTEICEKLKKDPDLEDVNIIMMSAYHDAEDLCRNAGAIDFIPKPFDMKGLMEKVNKIL